MKIKFKNLSLLLASSLLWVGCTNNTINQNANLHEGFNVASSKLSRELNRSVSQSELSSLASNNNSFAFDIFAKLHTNETGNLFFSPYSISEALAMTYAGAKGDTKTQMAQVLHFNPDDNALHTAFNALDLHLNHTDDQYTFSVANSLWAQKDYQFVERYLDTVKVHYGAGVSLLDFAEAEKSRTIINTWVEDKTHQRIKDLIPQGVLNASIKLVLTNAVYFKGQWENEFEEAATSDGTFHLLDGSTKQTPFMHQTKHFSYLSDLNYQAIDLPYKGERTSMVVVLPKEDKFESVLADIQNVYQHSIENMTETNINLSMPKFEFTTANYDLTNYFKALGMTDAFGNQADFSGMSLSTQLLIDSIIHKAFIKVDEQGTEAAAATAVMTRANSIPSNKTEMSIDRPFIFFIKDTKSGQVLFIGVVKSPKS